MKLKTIALAIALVILAGCQVKEVGTEKPELKTNKTIGAQITTLPKAMDLTGHWEGKFSFTNNCVSEATCRYRGKPKSAVMDIRHSMSGINVSFAVYFKLFVPEAILWGDPDEMCPTIKEFGVLRGNAAGLEFVANKFMFIDYFENLWEIRYEGGFLRGTISSDDPECMGMDSSDIELSRK